jgi:hypothetical protein
LPAMSTSGGPNGRGICCSASPGQIDTAAGSKTRRYAPEDIRSSIEIVLRHPFPAL